MDLSFYKNKRILVTGHTGFKGSWLCLILSMAGAELSGYSLEPPTNPSLYKIADIENEMNSITGDIRSFQDLSKAFRQVQPEILFHLAAQTIVRESYQNPLYTYETNVMGTANLLECVRQNKCVRSVLNVTTDKVYKNNEWVWGYRENEPLDGSDPYSNSKSCSELVTHCYVNSYFGNQEVSISTARAGNVIGGGDFAKDRIIPDCIRAVRENRPVMIRNPYSIRPYQHVLEPLYAYLMINQKQHEDKRLEGYYNVGPEEKDCINTGALVELFCRKWGEGFNWDDKTDNGPREANYLKLDCSKLKEIYHWSPCWNIETAVEKTVEWTKCYLNNENVKLCMKNQINDFLSGQGSKD